MLNLVAALAILGILAASLAFPATAITANLAVDGAAEQLARELQAARQMAVTQNLTYEVVFDWQSRSYTIKVADITVPGRRVYLPPEVKWNQLPYGRIPFKPSGRFEHNCTIRLGHTQSDYQVEIILAPRTGRVRVNR